MFQDEKRKRLTLTNRGNNQSGRIFLGLVGQQRSECASSDVSPSPAVSRSKVNLNHAPHRCESGHLNVVVGFAMMGSNKSMIEPIVCPLWVTNDRRFRSRRYHAWDRPCCSCGRKVVVSDAVKRQLDFSSGALLLCEQCAVISARKPKT